MFFKLVKMNKTLITNFILGPPNPDNVPEDGKLKSEMMIKDNRRYYMDLKENARGRFLRVRNIMYCYTGFPAHYDDTKI